MTRYWTELARDLSPYVPGEQPRIDGLVKLNTNESPFPPSPRAIAAVRAAGAESLRLYPDPQATRLSETLAAYHGLAPAQVFVGNGSDEVLAHAFAALLKQPAPLAFADVTYSFYPVWARLFGIACETLPVDADMRIDVSAYLGRSGPVIIANPNAPTGIVLPLADIERLVASRPDAAVVVDEAYIDFGGETAIPLLRDHPNLLIVRTMSKSRALAGLRVGYALGAPGLIEALTRVKDSFNSYPLGRPAQDGATASVEDDAYFEAMRAKVIALRARMTADLSALGCEVLPSSANFVFARHPGHSGAALAAALRERAVLVRRFSGPRIADYLRITVGSEDQIARLSAALADIVGA